jgi:hypothetical protein
VPASGGTVDGLQAAGMIQLRRNVAAAGDPC